MLDLAITELRSIAKNRGIEKYNNLDKDELLKSILLSSLSNELRLISKDELQNAFKKSNLFNIVNKQRNKI